MDNPVLRKDFHKLDVYRLDLEHLSENLYDFTISNTISWDIMSLRATKEELLGLADFIYEYLEKQ